MSSDLLGDSGGAIAEIEILRGDLIRILYAAAHDDVEYIFDDSITAISQGDDGIGVTFERGEPRRFDLVVGAADGLHSNVRAEARGRTVDGEVVPTPWQGRFWNYEERGGMRVPLDGEVAWMLPEGAKSYWRGHITEISYEFAR